MAQSFYITTAIDYPNGSPHLGHVYEKIITDVYARWYRFLGREVWFLTGTDENGQKLAKAAAESGAVSTLAFVDQNAEKFKQLCKDLCLTNNDFIRTTEKRHIDVAHFLWNTLEKKGDIYFDRYSGWYCIGCEAFYVESQAPELKCPNHGTPLEHQSEDGFFFRLSRYQDWIMKYICTNDAFVFPSSARKEILSRLESEGLKDLSVSRPNTGWGIPVPSNKNHVIYTWFDALINYLAAVQTPDLKHFWPADVHVIGKDITWFHAVIWPVMLHAAELPIHKQVYVHGMLLAEDGRKMSKSLNNVVDPYSFIGRYSNDLLRYYLMRAIGSGQDGRFSLKDMVDRNNNELANDFGNLASRVIKLSEKRIGKEIHMAGHKLEFNFAKLRIDLAEAMERREHDYAMSRLWEEINLINAYLNKHEPWRIKDDAEKFRHHMVNALFALHVIASLLEAFLPETSAKTLKMLGAESGGFSGANADALTFNLASGESLFPKIDIKDL